MPFFLFMELYIFKLANLEFKLIDFFAFTNCWQLVSIGSVQHFIVWLQILQVSSWHRHPIMHLAIMKFVKIWPGGTFLDLFFFLLPSLTTHFQVCTCAPKHVQILAVALDNWWHTLIWGMLVPLGPKLSDNEDRVYEHINELIKPNLKIRQRKRMNENKRM